MIDLLEKVAVPPPPDLLYFAVNVFEPDVTVIIRAELAPET
jgi:hypothetical protein